MTAPIAPEIEDLYRAHHGMVFRTAYRITGNAADAEDVLQTVFLRIWKKDASLIQNPESYLRRSAVNAALDVVRARQAAGQVALEDTVTSPACTELRELRDALRKALAKLNPKMAEIFALRFFEGNSNQEIANLLDMSQVLVAVTLHRARKQLQKELRTLWGVQL